MPNIIVKVRGNELFTWEGDVDEIANVTANFEKGAADIGMLADNFAATIIYRAVREGGIDRSTPAATQMTMMGIMYFLLATDTAHPEHPGKYRDYAAAWDFEFDITDRPSPDGGVLIDVAVSGESGHWA